MKSTDSCKRTRVTISVPEEAGENLKQLARWNTQLLNELGILSVQVDGAKPVVVAAMRNKGCPDAKTESSAAPTRKSNDSISGCWRPVEDIYSQVTPVLNQIQKHSRDLLMVPYRESLSKPSSNLCMPNGSCHSIIASTPRPKIQKASNGFIIENELRQRCIANSPLCSSKPPFFPLSMSQTSSYCGAGYHLPALPGTGIVASIHNDPLSNSLPVGCNDPLDTVFEPSHAKVQPLRQRKDVLNTMEKPPKEDYQPFVTEAEVVKVCLPTDILGSNKNVLPFSRHFHLNSNMGCMEKRALPGKLSKACECVVITTDSLSQTVVSKCKLNYSVVSSTLSGKCQTSQLDLNSSDKTDLKFSCTAPTHNATCLVDAGRSCSIPLASEDEATMHKLCSSLSDGCTNNPRSLAHVLSEYAKFSCDIPNLCPDGSRTSEADINPCGSASSRNASICVTSPSSKNVEMHDKSRFIESVSSNVDLFSSGDAASQPSTFEMSLFSSNGSDDVSILQTSCALQPSLQADVMFSCVEKDSSLGLSEICCARKSVLTEPKSGSSEPSPLQVSAEMKKQSGLISAAGVSRGSAVDALQLADVNSFHQMDELNSDLNADISEESAANEVDNVTCVRKMTMSLDRDLSCVTSGQLDAQLDYTVDVELLLPLASKFSSGDCTIMEELNNLPLEKAEKPELQQFQCVFAADASELVSETQQLSKASVDLILASDASDVVSVATANVNQDSGHKFPAHSPTIVTLPESSSVADFSTVPLFAAILPPSLTSESSQDTLHIIAGISPKENEPISVFNKCQESVGIVLDSNLTDRNVIRKPSRNGCQVGLRGKRSNDSGPLCLDWSGLSDEDIKVIKLNNRHSALDLHSPRFEEISVCSTKALSGDLRQLNALVMCEFDTLAVKASSLLCVTKLTDSAQSKLQSKKVRIIKSTDKSGNLRTKRKQNGHFSILEKHRMKRKTGRQVPMLDKDQRSQLFD